MSQDTQGNTEFNNWLDTLVEEKGLDTDRMWEIEGPSGPNFIPLGVVIENCKITCDNEQRQIKNILVKIDFLNGDVMHFFSHLARALAI